MAQALYRKYRPKVFDDVVGQQQIKKTLINAIDADNLSHAYLFCGPRGTGKTTMARLVAKACLCSNPSDNKSPTTNPCGECEDCTQIAQGDHPDVYELDAASRTGVDNVREEIIGRVGFAATKGTKKLYIIDEVHMLSTAAFNALLKTLEEPPNHVIFILCTTDPQKVPDTIISRCQRYNFAPINIEDIKERLRYVCECEEVQSTDNALEKIAKSANGAMRNALTQLEQLIAYTNGNITDQDILSDSSEEKKQHLLKLVKLIGERDLTAAMEWVEDYCNKGSNFVDLINAISKTYKNMFVAKACEDSKSFPVIIDLYSLDRLHRILGLLLDLQNNIKETVNQRLLFELFLAKISYPQSDLTLESLAERISVLEDQGNALQSQTNLNPAQTKTNVNEDDVRNNVNNSGFTNNRFKDSRALNNRRSSNLENNSGNINLPFVGEPLPEVNAGLDPAYEESFEPEIATYDNITNSNAKDGTRNSAEEVAKYSSEKKQEKFKNTDPLISSEIPKVESKDSSLKVENAFKSNNSKNSTNNSDYKNRGNNKEKKQDYTDDEVLQNTWSEAFGKIKNRYPAYGAILVTANAQYDKTTNQLILKFPASASFAIDSISKPDTMSKVHMVIKSVFGDDIGLDFRKSEETKDQVEDFNFVSSFREDKADDPAKGNENDNDNENYIDKDKQSSPTSYINDQEIKSNYNKDSKDELSQDITGNNNYGARDSAEANMQDVSSTENDKFKRQKPIPKVPTGDEIKEMLKEIGATDIKEDKE